MSEISLGPRAPRGLRVRVRPCPEAASADTQGPQGPTGLPKGRVEHAWLSSTPRLIRVLLNEVQGSLSIQRSSSDSAITASRWHRPPPDWAEPASAWGWASYCGRLEATFRPPGGGP